MLRERARERARSSASEWQVEKERQTDRHNLLVHRMTIYQLSHSSGAVLAGFHSKQIWNKLKELGLPLDFLRGARVLK